MSKKKVYRNQQIVAEHQQGVLQVILADLHGISKQRVSKIIKDYNAPQTPQGQKLRGLWGRVIANIKSAVKILRKG